MFELHDALLYVMSICTLVSLAYLCLVWIPSEAVAMRRTHVREADNLIPANNQTSGMHEPRSRRLTRQTKRKEAPDDDSSPCMSLLMN
ncbi:hypothetical protein [Paenibacillus montanisoli]|uniref:Uncharacterized protein n=1 Tax=Paenibacillus montanisoli TaxID=2081970 RepID=A0A328U1J9_9BACL|nr:hypothetical protein [Paenibacillus montanisoli]RAP75633.1 hypothetical protein DL346_09225 [Paenibacillus montanisoli]